MLHAVRPKKRTPNPLMESAFQWPNRVQAAKRFPKHSTLELTTTLADESGAAGRVTRDDDGVDGADRHFE